MFMPTWAAQRPFPTLPKTAQHAEHCLQATRPWHREGEHRAKRACGFPLRRMVIPHPNGRQTLMEFLQEAGPSLAQTPKLAMPESCSEPDPEAYGVGLCHR